MHFMPETCNQTNYLSPSVSSHCTIGNRLPQYRHHTTGLPTASSLVNNENLRARRPPLTYQYDDPLARGRPVCVLCMSVCVCVRVVIVEVPNPRVSRLNY